jgi:hypothetical protein
MREREPERWERVIICGCVSAVSLVLTVCLVIFMIGSLFFGLAYMSEHWPS